MVKAKTQTPPQFIWAILQKNLTVKVVKDNKEKIIKYKVPEFEPVPDAKCWLCGGDTDGLGLLKKRRITKMFSDTEFAQFPGSQSLCTGCGGLLSNAAMRFYSLFADETCLLHPTRKEWREILLAPPALPWVGCLSISGQKHLFYKAPVNFSAERCTVVLEDFVIAYRPAHLAEFLKIIEDLLQVFNKTEIKTGRYYQGRIKDYGITKWAKMEEQIKNIRGEPFFELALHVAIKVETKVTKVKVTKVKVREETQRCSPCELQQSLPNTDCQP